MSPWVPRDRGLLPGGRSRGVRGEKEVSTLFPNLVGEGEVRTGGVLTLADP